MQNTVPKESRIVYTTYVHNLQNWKIAKLSKKPKESRIMYTTSVHNLRNQKIVKLSKKPKENRLLVFHSKAPCLWILFALPVSCNVLARVRIKFLVGESTVKLVCRG